MSPPSISRPKAAASSARDATAAQAIKQFLLRALTHEECGWKPSYACGFGLWLGRLRDGLRNRLDSQTQRPVQETRRCSSICAPFANRSCSPSRNPVRGERKARGARM